MNASSTESKLSMVREPNQESFCGEPIIPVESCVRFQHRWTIHLLKDIDLMSLLTNCGKSGGPKSAGVDCTRIAIPLYEVKYRTSCVHFRSISDLKKEYDCRNGTSISFMRASSRQREMDLNPEETIAFPGGVLMLGTRAVIVDLSSGKRVLK